MTNRTIAPSLHIPEKINIKEPQRFELKSGVPIVVVNEGTQQVFKLEMIFDAGNCKTTNSIISIACNDLMDEGTQSHTGNEIAEIFDSYGAYLQTECNNDYASLSLSCITKFIGDTLPIFLEVISQPLFPENEVNLFKQQGRQRLAVNLEKVDFIARKQFLTNLYGPESYMGKFPSTSDYDEISTKVLTHFYDSNYKNGLVAIIISGNFNDSDLKFVLKELENVAFGKLKLQDNSNKTLSPSKILINKEDALQSAIRIGRRLFNRSHPDYFKFTILNTLLGGYFGSRLMSNIREDKGYTYGIGSGVAPMKNDGYFYITTEVGSDVREDAVNQIYLEINRLCNEFIPLDELNLVKNYLFGSFQRSIDGSFSLADRHKILLLNGLSISHLESYLETLKNVTSEELLETARLYLQAADLTEVVVGR
jgi:predicted Zn-dependent peptidase